MRFMGCRATKEFDMTLTEYSENQLLAEKTAAKLLALSPRTLRNWRVQGNGPKFVKVSKRAIRYRYGDLIKWSELQTRSSTSDRGILKTILT